jgi:hypothetical protein
MKMLQREKFIVGGILSVFLVAGVIPAFAQTDMDAVRTLNDGFDFSVPSLVGNKQEAEVLVQEATGVLTKEGCPLLPMFSKTYEFPLGTRIISVDVQPTTIQTVLIDTQIKPVPTQEKRENQIVPMEGIFNEDIYGSSTPYPGSWFTVNSGAGLNRNNDHTLFVSIHITPVRYSPRSHSLLYSTHFTLEITYEEATQSLPTSSETYPLVIIAPSKYSEALLPLVDHKNTFGFSTNLVLLDEVYDSYYGRDHSEQIKYFVKHAVEDWNTHYILLVGDMKTLPIRFTYASWWERDLLSDLYYADIYDASGEFCSWDSNGNNRFGEVDNHGNDLDGVDLYADVHIGRLACVDVTEVTTVVNKIITYEQETYDQIWFKRIILAGGDTFPVSNGAPPFVYEGEITNIKVGQTMLDFEQTYLWTSKCNLHPWNFNWAINRGAGFVSYAGHGFEHGWGTSRPNAVTKIKIYYYTPYINGLKNGNKLPIIFFDACLTAKLDFNITDLQHYYPRSANLLARILGLSADPMDFYQCFAWSLLARQNGGAIATIGSTRTAYTWVDANGVYGGAGYLDVHFFDSYEEGITVGQMLTGSQNAYIQNVGADYFTIEEFMLLGDPSLRVGGYP